MKSSILKGVANLEGIKLIKHFEKISPTFAALRMKKHLRHFLNLDVT